MNKKDIIDTLKKYNFDSTKYIVISSAAMVLLGIKDTTKDIDIAVSDDYYEYLLKNYNCKFERINEYGKKVYFIHDIINFSSTYYKNNRLIIEEIPIQTANDILELKLFLKREKDYKDIKLIKEYINEQE
ncbi:MAG: hypothetical protein MRZ34_00895 [Bacillales bacterium]|nr:hypothetical protein [Bacillales bacterium]